MLAEGYPLRGAPLVVKRPAAELGKSVVKGVAATIVGDAASASTGQPKLAKAKHEEGPSSAKSLGAASSETK